MSLSFTISIKGKVIAIIIILGSERGRERKTEREREGGEGGERG